MTRKSDLDQSRLRAKRVGPTREYHLIGVSYSMKGRKITGKPIKNYKNGVELVTLSFLRTLRAFLFNHVSVPEFKRRMQISYEN